MIVGLTIVEPVCDVDVNPPGLISTRAAPVVDQLSVVLSPGTVCAGLASNEAISGFLSPVGLGLWPAAMPEPVVKPTQASSVIINVMRGLRRKVT